MPELISEVMPQSKADEIRELLEQANKLFDPFFHNLTAATKTGLNNMAEGREGLARLVSKVALANPDDLSRKDNPQDLANRLDYDAMLEDLRQRANSIIEKIEETQKANGHDTMTYVKAYRAALENNRTRNSALDNAMAPIDDWYARFANTGDTAKPATPGS